MTAATKPGVGEAVLLAGLPGMGPRRLSALLDAWDPADAWARATSGRIDRLALPDGTSALHVPTTPAAEALALAWRHAGSDREPADALADHHAQGVLVLLRDDPRYPLVLRDDLEPPAVLFARGDLSCLERPRAAVVGTRRCTGLGAGFARELGRELAAADVAVVSGLALGVDGAAHRGVLDSATAALASAPPVGVVGSGLDVVYPAR
ncbi:MAG: DNA-processing protein DprA, partial [Acidimicrobiales bacterium]